MWQGITGKSTSSFYQDGISTKEQVESFVDFIIMGLGAEDGEGLFAGKGGRAFFSGAGAEARAIEQGYQTLGQTRAGRNLQNLIDSKNIPWGGAGGAESMWRRLSTTWANGIPNGSSVPVFLNNPRAGSVWLKTELPILQSKGVNLIYK